MLIPFFVGILIIAVLDQAAKLFAAGLLQGVDTVPLWNKVFHLTYVENRGAGWGMFSDHTWLLTVATIIVVVAVVGYVVAKKPKNPLLLTAFTFMIGGAVGNLVDRVRQGFVIDFFDFTLINFPVFNVADCFITVGAIVFVIYVLFFSDKKEK